MRTVDELRAEAGRLRQMAQSDPEPQESVRLATRALQLAERAEAIERSDGQPEIIRENIARYSSMLSEESDDGHRQHIEDMLADAQALLARLPLSDTSRFISERNIGLFARQLYEERDPARQQTLQRLLIDEEHRYGLHEWHLELADRRIAEADGRIAKQKMLVDGMETQGHDAALAKVALEQFMTLRALFIKFRNTVAEKLARTRL